MSSTCARLALAAAGLLPATLLAASASTTADGLSHCVAIANDEARLKCYDTLAGRAAQAPAPAPAEGTPAAAPPVAAGAPAAVAPAASAPVVRAPSVAEPAAAPPVTVAPQPAPSDENFGLSSAQVHAAPGPQSIQAHVASVTVDQSMRNFVVLDNGQTWLSTEGELQLVSGELVTIRRAALGSFMLASTVSKHSYHVRRVR